MSHLPRVNLDEPRWDQSTYLGRAKRFFNIANPFNILVSNKRLEEARSIVLKYKNGEELSESITMEDVYRAKDLYDSAFHPDTGEKMILIGRMSAQAPMNMFITGMMMTFYKSTRAVVFWQWFNQSFNAIVNYTNRSGNSKISDTQLAQSYVLGTGGALVTALTLNRMVTLFFAFFMHVWMCLASWQYDDFNGFAILPQLLIHVVSLILSLLTQRAPPLIGRLVPFAAVAAANCINIPMMRIRELENGIPVYDSNHNKLGESKVAAKTGIATVVVTRIIMASPSMVLTPVIVNTLEKRGLFKKYPWSLAPIQLLVCGIILTFATPMACAIFSQQAQIDVRKLEKEIQEEAAKRKPPAVFAYYNKGL